MLNIPYAGPDVLGLAVCMDKDMTKRVLRDAGVPVTPLVTLLRTGDAAPDVDAIIGQLGLALFIKPPSQGSSRAGFRAALAFRYDAKVLVEQGISGREIETAVLGNDSPEVSVCGEILANDEFYAYDTKYLIGRPGGTSYPGGAAPASVADALRQMTGEAYLALGCSVMARVDFFLTDQGQILLNEVNTLPGFTSISMYPKLWEASGLDYPALVDRLIA